LNVASVKRRETRAGTSLWHHLADLFAESREAEGMAKALQRFFRAMGALGFQAQHRQLLGLRLFREYIAIDGATDVLFHLSHRYFLSSAFTYVQRIECALSHYRYEDGRYDDIYKHAVYGDGGLPLWATQIDADSFLISLRESTRYRHEGGVSVLLSVNTKVVCEMSFAWVDAAIFGADCGVCAFITRNQSTKPDSPELVRFRQAFPHNSPQYCCLAAVHGISWANGKSHLFAIRHECQIAFDSRYAESFRNSYCEVWKSFGGVGVGSQAYLMSVPMTATPLADVKSKHRKRAHERRCLWAMVEATSKEVIARRLNAGAA
jgi:uncharacterized protein VirK/YbjX